MTGNHKYVNHRALQRKDDIQRHLLTSYLPCVQMAGGGQAWQKDAADQNFDYMFKLLIIGENLLINSVPTVLNVSLRAKVILDKSKDL
jgi:hypothetical protein